MNDLGDISVSIDDLRTGNPGDLLGEADVIIALDANTREEEIVRGRHEWEIATATGHEEDLTVVRVELDMEAGDLEWLLDAVEAIESDEMDDRGDSFDADDEDDG